MAAERARPVHLLDVLRLTGAISPSVLLRVALDVLETMAAGKVTVALGPRRAGSRHVIANVELGARGKARLVGRGNKSGVAVLLWEILAGCDAPATSIPALGVVSADAEIEVAEVVNAAILGRSDLPDVRALVKALVIASAGTVGTSREIAKLVRAAAILRDAPRSSKRPAPRNSALLPPAPEGAPLGDLLKAASDLAAPSAPASAKDPTAAALDAVMSDELARIAPDGWDKWDIAAKEAAPEEIVSLDDAIVLEEKVKRAPPPLPHHRRADVDVVLIEPHAPTAAHLAAALRRIGYGVEICDGIDAGISRACATQPRCVLCDLELLDQPGPSISLRARTNSPRACLAPFIFLTAHERQADATPTRAGSRDVWLKKPFSTDALLEHVARFAGLAKAPSGDSSMLPPLGETAMDGDLALISLRAVLSMLEFEKRSGVLNVTGKVGEATIRFRDGRATRTRVLGRSMRAIDGVETLLTWNAGHFSFKPTIDTGSERAALQR